jgi:hypothetical protein
MTTIREVDIQNINEMFGENKDVLIKKIKKDKKVKKNTQPVQEEVQPVQEEVQPVQEEVQPVQENQNFPKLKRTFAVGKIKTAVLLPEMEIKTPLIEEFDWDHEEDQESTKIKLYNVPQKSFVLPSKVETVDSVMKTSIKGVGTKHLSMNKREKTSQGNVRVLQRPTLEYTKSCLFCKKKDDKWGVCYREICTFAHSLAELQISPCSYGIRCMKKKGSLNVETGKIEKEKSKCCQYKHPDETNDEYYIRTGSTKPDLPATSEMTRQPKVKQVSKQEETQHEVMNLDTVVIQVPREMQKEALEMCLMKQLKNFKIILTD